MIPVVDMQVQSHSTLNDFIVQLNGITSFMSTEH